MTAQAATTTTNVNLLKRLWGDKVAEPAYKRSRALARMWLTAT